MEEMTAAEVLFFAQEAYHDAVVVDIEQLAQSGSPRINYRIKNGANRSIIATQSANVKENETFMALSNYFSYKEIAVPQILAVHPSLQLYLQSDVGHESLLDAVLAKGHTAEVKELYKQTLLELIEMQLCPQDEKFQEFFKALPHFGHDQILFDLNYFKNNFALKSAVPFDEKALNDSFEQLAGNLDNEKNYFMFRDCQGRNVMLLKNKVSLIDFQGGMQGHPMYDVASLLWQAKANLPVDWKGELLDFYLSSFEAITLERGIIFDKSQWEKDYAWLTLTRLLQVLGAYGLRGLVEGKEHFISSIPLGLKNIKEWLRMYPMQQHDELMKVLQFIAGDDFIKKFKN